MAVTAHRAWPRGSYPTSEVRGRSRRTLCPRAAAKKGYPVSEVRGSDPECQAETVCRNGQRSSPTSEVRGRARRSNPTSKFRGGG